jgi:signal transduction histidine kinase
MASLALIVGIVVAVFAARQVGKLGQEIEQRRLAEQANRHRLERLSAGLVSSQEEERRALARELHDAVGQALTAINMDVEVALRDNGLGDRARGALQDTRTLAESTLQSIRNLSQLLHPPVLSDFGLIEAIRVHLRSFATHSGVRAELAPARLDERLPANVELCAYRIVQEALTNIARHSGASSCVVAISRRDDVLRVSVEDDGRGVGSSARSAQGRRGLGLLAMRERAQALNGSLIVEDRAEGGTRVLVQLPVPSRGAQDELPAVELRRLAV